MNKSTTSLLPHHRRAQADPIHKPAASLRSAVGVTGGRGVATIRQLLAQGTTLLRELVATFVAATSAAAADERCEGGGATHVAFAGGVVDAAILGETGHANLAAGWRIAGSAATGAGNTAASAGTEAARTGAPGTETARTGACAAGRSAASAGAKATRSGIAGSARIITASGARAPRADSAGASAAARCGLPAGSP